MFFRLFCLIGVMAAGLASAEEAKKVIRVLTWNLHHGEGVDGKLDLQRQAEVIRAQSPDVVLLQEVDRNCKRTGSVDQPAELARLTGLHYAFGKAMDFQGGEYGQLILSRTPITDLRVHRLPGTNEPRIAISAMVETTLGPIAVAGIHLDYQDEAVRLAQAQVAAAAILETAKGPIVLAGDFNDHPQSKTLAIFGQAPWSVVSKSNPGTTHPAEKPTDEIDFVVVRGLRAEGNASVVAEANASDHRPVLTVLKLPE